MLREHARIARIVVLLVGLGLGVGVAGEAARGAGAEPAVDPAIRCALLHGRPALAACEAWRRIRGAAATLPALGVPRASEASD